MLGRISVDDLEDLLGDGTVVVDVRSPPSFSARDPRSQEPGPRSMGQQLLGMLQFGLYAFECRCD